jgi:hypothetical protein
MGKRLVWGVAHQILSPYVLMAITALIVYTVVGMMRGTVGTVQSILFGTPYYPAQIAVGLIAGYVVGRYFAWPLTGWTWGLPGVLLLGCLAFAPVPQSISHLDYWFGWSGLPGHAVPPLQVGITMPFYLSVAYSLAALLGARDQRLRKHISIDGLTA